MPNGGWMVIFFEAELVYTEMVKKINKKKF